MKMTECHRAAKFAAFAARDDAAVRNVLNAPAIMDKTRAARPEHIRGPSNLKAALESGASQQEAPLSIMEESCRARMRAT